MSAWMESAARTACLFGNSNKLLFTPIGKAIQFVAAECKILKTALQEVFGGELGNGSMVGNDPRKLWNVHCRADVDNGDLQFQQCIDSALVFDARDHAVDV